MRNLITIFCIFIFLILSSVCPEKPIPEHIKLNELYTWNTKRQTMELSDIWLICIKNGTKDSLSVDAWRKMETIKQHR
jgi:hypothetical protein